MRPTQAVSFIRQRTGIKMAEKRYKEYVQYIQSKDYFDSILTDKVEYDIMQEHFNLYSNLKAFLNQINRTLLVNYSIPSHQISVDRLTKLVLTGDQVIQTMVKMNLVDPAFAKFKYSIENNLIVVNNNNEIEENDTNEWEAVGNTATNRISNIISEKLEDKVSEHGISEQSDTNYEEYDKYIARNNQKSDTGIDEQYGSTETNEQNKTTERINNASFNRGTEKRIRTISRDDQQRGTGASERIF